MSTSETVQAAKDSDLLQLAAKAAGVRYDSNRVIPNPVSGAFFGLWLLFDHEPGESARRYWNPLKDDGDALRLAVKLGMLATYSGERFELFQATYRKCLDQDMKPSEATRRAIVMVAAQAAQPAPAPEDAERRAPVPMGQCAGGCDTSCPRQ